MPDIPGLNTPGVALIFLGLLALGIAVTNVNVTGTIKADLSQWPARTVAVLIGVYLCGFGAWLLHPVKFRFLRVLILLPVALCLCYLTIARLAAWPPFVKNAQQYLEIGNDELKQGDCKGAKKTFNKSFNLASENDLAERGAAELGLAKAVECDLVRAQNESTRIDAADDYEKAAGLLKEAKHWAGVREALDGLVKLEPARREAWEGLLDADQNLTIPDWTSAEHASEEILNLAPDASAYGKLATVLQQTGTPDQIEITKRTIQCLTQNPQPPDDLSRAYASSPHLRPDGSNASALLCEYQRIQLGLNKLPKKDIDSCRQYQEHCWLGYFHKDFGRLLNQQGFYYRALYELLESEGFPGRDKDIYVQAGLGDAYSGLHEKQKACTSYNNAIAVAETAQERGDAQDWKNTAGCS